MDSVKFDYPESQPPVTTYQPVPPPPYAVAPPPPGLVSHLPSASVQTEERVVTIGTTASKFGPYSQNVFCPSCRQITATSIRYKTGVVTWLTSAGCFLLGGVIGCFLIPCCTDFTRDVEHSCVNCGLKVGLYRRI
ncbi:lipopolysaccharide-induced tumor necrosis factor-alpha factor homolog [Panonychus citri]|uniref:lipopolysaccharide-induced tumor necrosis factor-alpha factor homolog n=1 Tax=Panonychus citri TaxID=50023 RepID=UPI002307D48F|nr:lipopolysaccharide-induced tumor necrosis factor-alpha factor homolog [Panonychus citri]